MGYKICPVCQMALENEHGDCMCLPEGNTCYNCQTFERCKALGVAKEGQKICDWFPVRFKMRVLQQNGRGGLRQMKSCGYCKYYDGVCCMYDCQAIAILDDEKSAQNCQHYVVGEYDPDELEKTDYK